MTFLVILSVAEYNKIFRIKDFFGNIKWTGDQNIPSESNAFFKHTFSVRLFFLFYYKTFADNTRRTNVLEIATAIRIWKLFLS